MRRAAAAGFALALALACSTSTASPPPPAAYAGRPIASTCSYAGAAWLDRPERGAREQPDRVLEALALTPDMTVADVGAGTGYFSLRLARRVAHVVATDLQPEMLRALDQRRAAARLTNVELRAATDHDSGLAEASVDLVLMVDVYHELADPAGVVGSIRRALRPGGELVLVEYRGEDPKVPIRTEHKMTLAQIERELPALGFTIDHVFEFLPDQRIVVLVPSLTSRPL